jgi:asparagine synthase (glutamine-hydrolysing)
MCGIAGKLQLENAPCDLKTLKAMLGAIRHRGPEATGVYLDGQAGLGHNRLSIIDLEGGLQPISNEDGSCWIVCNGEVFNYIELRQELIARGHLFRTGSDSEVILHLYEEHGPECLHRLIGQYAFAIWDSTRGSLLLARDRLGVRPLFYARTPDALCFASEVKALLATGHVRAELDLETLDQVFTYWAPLPGRTAFLGVSELPPGHYLQVSSRQSAQASSFVPRRYWSLNFDGESAAQAKDARFYAEGLLDLLVDATRLRLRADVPVGAYLSGGLDSSAIAAIVRRYTSNKLKTFSIAFTDKHFDESAFQQRMAEHLGTEHIAFSCTEQDIADVFPDVVRHVEIPILRTSPAPMFILSRLVRQNGLKVVLTGEGSDEFLGGYDIFKEAQVRRFWARVPTSKLRPVLLRKLYGDVKGISTSAQSYLEGFFRNGLTETENPHYSHLIRWRSTSRSKRLLSRETRETLGAYESGPELEDALDGLSSGWDSLSQAQFIESRLFMSQYLLSSQGDRVGMAHAVEGRFPFLDHRVVEFAATIPPRLRLRGLEEKYILKRALSDLLPAQILARTKRPYRAPIRDAFLGPGAPDYVREMLSQGAVSNAGVFDPVAVSMLVKKAEASPVLGEADSMALVGVLSTQLLHHLFIERPQEHSSDDNFPVVVLERDDIRSRDAADERVTLTAN